MKIFDEPILKQVDNLCKQAKILTNKQRLKQTLIGKLLDFVVQVYK